MKFVDYIFGSRRGHDANSLEKESLSDPFLADAMEGYDAVYDNHHDILGELHQKVEVRAAKKQRVLAATGRKLYVIVGVAAAIIVGVSVTLISVLRKPAVENEMIAMNLPPANEEVSQRVVASDAEEVSAVVLVDDDVSGMASNDAGHTQTVADISENAVKLVKDNIVSKAILENETAALAENDADAASKISVAALRSRSVAEPVTSESSDVAQKQADETTVAAVVQDDAANILKVVRNERFDKYFAANQRALKSAAGVSSGTFVVEFRVNDAGIPTSVRVVSGVSQEANRKVIELLVSGPAWEPTGDERVRTVLKY